MIAFRSLSIRTKEHLFFFTLNHILQCKHRHSFQATEMSHSSHRKTFLFQKKKVRQAIIRKLSDNHREKLSFRLNYRTTDRFHPLGSSRYTMKRGFLDDEEVEDELTSPKLNGKSFP